ncbi:MAG: YkgJ family cysteine cluster protein [Promethearchaeota archaeon]
MVNEFFWKIVEKFNYLMKSAIEGPSCLDPSICHGDCCSIKIDVPKVLAKEFIRRGYAKKEDFIRSNVFSFHLRFDEMKGKCFLFDKKINGCSVHNSGIKPPQCWIYPTNFSNPDFDSIDCKRAEGWRIIDSNKTKEAEDLLKKYVFLCQIEAKKEMKNVKKRINKICLKNKFRDSIKSIPPSQLAGFKDGWTYFNILSAEGISLQMKKFCLKYNKSCTYVSNNNFLKCKAICDLIANQLIEFLQLNLYYFIKKNGLNHEGAYPLHKLFEFNKILINSN